jgi:hypothetical protein
MLRVVLTVVSLSTFAATAFAGELPPMPLPLAGVSGPFGVAILAAVYAGYRIYKHYVLKR